MPNLQYACVLMQAYAVDMDTTDATQVILVSLSRLMDRLDQLAPASQPRLLTVQEAATALGVSRDTIRRMCDRREIRYVQTEAGAAKRIALADIQAWIDRHAVPPLRAT